MPTKCCNRSTGTPSMSLVRPTSRTRRTQCFDHDRRTCTCRSYIYVSIIYIYFSINFVTINNRVGTYFHQTWLFRCCHLYYLNGVGGLVDRTVAKDHTKQQAIKFRVRKCSKKNFPSPSSCRACCSVPPHLAHHRCLRADCPSRSVRHLTSSQPHLIHLTLTLQPHLHPHPQFRSTWR